jgi:hypothetical protein
MILYMIPVMSLLAGAPIEFLVVVIMLIELVCAVHKP